METVSQKEVELAGLGVELQRVQSSLTNERESGVKAAEALQNQLNEKVGYCMFTIDFICLIIIVVIFQIHYTKAVNLLKVNFAIRSSQTCRLLGLFSPGIKMF